MRASILLPCLILSFVNSCKERTGQYDDKDNPRTRRSASNNPNSQNSNDLNNNSPSPENNNPSSEFFIPTTPDAEGPNSTSKDGGKTNIKGKIGVTQAPPTGMALKGDRGIAPPDYQTCAGLPTVGKQKYPAKCQENHVMAIINDGKAQEMTCCPLVGKNILSNVPSEQFIERTGRCQENEVGVGMVAAHQSIIYCTKINAQYLKLTSPVTALYAKSNAALTSVMKQIASTYNVKDTCICPEKSILIGNHSVQDNVCKDLCVEIVAK